MFFAKGNENLRTHYLHIEVFNGLLWENHIYFRNYLRSNKESALEYSRLKNELAAKFPEDRNAYTNGKDEFINSILEKVREELIKE